MYYCTSNKKFIKVCCFKRSKRIYERFKVYQETNKDIAEEELLKLDDKWSKKYHILLQSCHNKWKIYLTILNIQKRLEKLCIQEI